jgi:putative oxidoreductase
VLVARCGVFLPVATNSELFYLRADAATLTTTYTFFMFLNWLNQYRDVGLFILRVGFGLLMLINHGWGKITSGPEQWAKLGETMALFGLGFAPTFWGFMAALAESVGALLLVVGLLARPAAILLILNMTVAASMHIITGNGSPLTAIYFWLVFVTLLITGPGKYAVDYFFSKQYRRRGY